MNTNEETRRLYAAWIECCHDEYIPWRTVRLRPQWRFGHWNSTVSTDGRFHAMYGSSLQGATPREAFANFRRFLTDDIRSRREMREALPAFRARLAAASATRTPRILTETERVWCKARELEIAFDLDDERFCPTQLRHIAARRPTFGHEALCRTPFLWFGGGGFDSPRGDGSFVEDDNRISCPICLGELEKAMATP